MVITAVVILALVVDMELSNVADILQRTIASERGIITFIIITTIYLFGQYLILKFSKAKTIELRTRNKEVRLIDMLVSIAEVYCHIYFCLSRFGDLN